MVQSVVLAGRDYVLIEREEFERIVAEAKIDLPRLPEPDAEGLTPAVEYGRALLARKLIRRREALKLTQTSLAKRARIRHETLNRIERGRVTPDERTLSKILKVLDRGEAGKNTV